MKRWKSLPMAAGAVLLCLTAGLQAQTVYRIVGPDGRVTFSDKPLAADSPAKVSAAATGAGGAGAASAALPVELRQAVGRYPVTIYTAADCEPCNAGRSLLTGRGVPFSERTVSTAEDAAALQRLSGERSLPFMTIGGQRVKGFSDLEWSQYLDAAGYPKSSKLPNGYRNPPAAPLVVVQKPAAEAAAPAPQAPIAPAPAAAAPAGPGPSNPAGITF